MARDSSQYRIDPLRLDEELIELGQRTLDITELAADAMQARDEAKHELAIAEAEATFEVTDRVSNSDKKPLKMQIEHEVLLAPSVRKAHKALLDAEHEYAVCQAHVQAIRQKATSIKIYADLIATGYLTPDAAYMERRRELAAARSERSKLRRRED